MIYYSYNKRVEGVLNQMVKDYNLNLNLGLKCIYSWVDDWTIELTSKEFNILKNFKWKISWDSN